MTYFEIPVLVRYEFVSQGALKPFFVAGPAVGFKLGTSVTADGEDLDADDEDLKAGEVSFVIGGGMRRDRVSFEARYTAGGNTVKDLDEDEFFKNRTFSVLVSFALR